MKKSKIILLVILGMFILSSCGIFHKGCGCPTFGHVKSPILRKSFNS
ncbi:hypothetical protein [Mucilaginibacter xinganensis]|uniref:Lipoprotein n=1 Tax=Mucilaginibacter xinganensis TaxID=1234841 RepID=A0A223P3N9_9SPHI|nr:hypothetical protein [Mucilaginibacter xinganensis]ASU36468.1 hypothetical protein MuYL_4583 [Mucilaginibacter xinganensis]